MNTMWSNVLIFALSVVLCLIVYFLVRNRLVKTVKNTSKVLRDLESINGKIKYKSVEKSHLYSYSCLSRAEFNRFDLDNYFTDIIRDNINHFQKLIKNNRKQ